MSIPIVGKADDSNLPVHPPSLRFYLKRREGEWTSLPTYVGKNVDRYHECGPFIYLLGTHECKANY
jgi:hypothetical protein